MGLFSPRKTYHSSASLTADGERVRRRDADAIRRLIQPWQSRAFAYVDLVPEVSYASLFYARGTSVLRLYAGERDENGEINPTENEKVIEQVERIKDPGGGGRSGLLYAYGRLMFIAGEGYLFVSQDPETGLEQWEMLSTDELRVTSSGYVRYKAPSLAADEYDVPDDDDYSPIDDKSAIAYRIWRRHPRYSMLADSTMHSVLDVCEELVLLTQAVRARARSRLAGNGILIVNGRVIPAPLEAAADEDPDADPFLRDFIDALVTPITNEGTASAVVPQIVRVDPGDEGIDNVMKHIQIVDPMQLYPETGLRQECVTRLAIGLDMPREILEGLQDSNHWSAWQVDEQVWKAHLQPIADQLVNDLTSAFLLPTLRDEGIADWSRYVVAYDASAVVNHPDRTDDAKQLYAARAIGKKAYRTAAGFTDEDAPTEEELAEMVGVAVRDGQLAMTGVPTDRSTGNPAGGDDLPEDGAEGEHGPPNEGEPPPPPDDLVGSSASEQIVARIVGAADLTLYRARELAGARLRNYAKRDREAEQALDGVRALDVASLLGRDRARAVGAPSERELVAGARDLLADALRLWKLDEALLEPLGDRIEQHAARTLFDERPAPLAKPFENYVRGLVAKAAR